MSNRWRVTITVRQPGEPKSRDSVHEVTDLAVVGTLLASLGAWSLAYVNVIELLPKPASNPLEETTQ